MNNPRNRIIYNQAGLFVGPSPSDSYTYLTSDGVLVNSLNLATFNLTYPLLRINNISYGFNPNRIDVKHLGDFGTIARPIVSSPDVNLSINYYQQGLINEARLGFLFNYPTSGVVGATPLYGTGRVCPISALVDRQFNRGIDNEIGYPLTTRDSRNIFVATKTDTLDLNSRAGLASDFSNSKMDTYAFGDCYITNYRTRAAIGEFPECSVDFVCGNLVYYTGCSGLNIPSVNPQNKTIRSGIIFNLPNNFEGTGNPTVLLPKDINVTLSLYDGTNLLNNNLPISFNDIKIQSYDISLDFNRENLYCLGYKLPLDRRINDPIYANINFSVIVGDTNTGSLIDHVTQDEEYNINIKLNYQPRQLSGITAINYDFIGAKFNGINFSEAINQRRMATFSFTSELNVNSIAKGFFISGQLGIPTGSVPNDSVLLVEDSNTLVYEGGDGTTGVLIDIMGSKLLF